MLTFVSWCENVGNEKSLGLARQYCECGRRRRVEETSWPGEDARGTSHQSHVRKAGGSVAPPEPAARGGIHPFIFIMFCGAREWPTSSISDLPSVKESAGESYHPLD